MLKEKFKLGIKIKSLARLTTFADFILCVLIETFVTLVVDNFKH